MSLQAFFLPVGNGRRFCLFHPAQGAIPKGSILYLPPFAEEMNCVRQMVANQARQMAAAGYSVLQIDYLGTGDSDGLLQDSTWALWGADVHAAIDWLEQKTKQTICLWGVRASCLLASQVASQRQQKFNFLFWQPVVSGESFLRQMLRIRTLNEALSGRSKTTVDMFLKQLAANQCVEVAGYNLPPELVSGWRTAQLLASDNIDQIAIIEVSSRSRLEISGALLPVIDDWKTRNITVVPQVVAGNPYWQKIGRVDCSNLNRATLLALQGCSP